MAAASASAILSNPSRSWWLDNLPGNLVPPPCTSLPTTADVVIIGAGLTGCATAFWLQRLYGRSSVIVDARGLAGGATGRNGGHLWPNPKSDFERITVEELLSFIEAEGIECDLTHDGAVALERCAPEEGVEYHDAAGDPEVGEGEDEDWGETPVLDAAACTARLQTDAFTEATLYDGARQFYPAKVAAALLRASEATLYAPVRVLSLEAVEASSAAESAEDHTDPEASGTTLVTTDRGVVRARSVVVCTNGWAAELLPELADHLVPCRNQVVMTAPVPAALAWEVGALSVDSDVGARELYMIRRPDGRLCLGGARALEPGAAVGSTDDASLSADVGAYLRRFLREAFPRLGEVRIEAEWTGVLGFTRDKKPLVGLVRPNVFVGVGFCGHGMPQCTGVGKALAQMVAGADDTEVHPFVRGVADVGRVLSK